MLDTTDAAVPRPRVQPRDIALGLFAALFLVGLYYGFVDMVGDFTKYHEAAHDWTSGAAQLYDRYGYFYMPWSMVLILPLAALGLQLGAAVFRALTSLCLLYSVARVATEPRRLAAMALALACPFSIVVIYMSQWDPITMAAAFVGFGAARDKRPWVLGLALVVMATKPTNVWMSGVLLLGMMVRWPVRDIAKTLALPAVVGLLSFVVAGFDWPVRYWKMLGAFPPSSVNVALVRNEAFGLPLWPVAAAAVVIAVVWIVRELRRGPTELSFIIALVANLLVSPYVVPYHFAHSAPAIAWLTNRSTVAGVLTIPVFVFGAAIFWQDAGSVFINLYSVLILVLLVVWNRRSNAEMED